MISHFLATALLITPPVMIDSPVHRHQNSAAFPSITTVTDQELATVTGRQGWSMTSANLKTIANDQSYGSDRFIAANAVVQMDVWWGTIGSQLIAESVRAGAN